MTNAELAVLSLIAEQPRHGYEVERVIDARGMREWTEVGFSSIYYLLNKLERQGLVEARRESAGRGPARKVYSLTPLGGKCLREAVLNALSEPRRTFPAILLGLASLPVVSPGEALAALHRYENALAAHLARLEDKRAAQQPLPYFVNAVFEHGTASLKAELAWARAFTQQLEGNMAKHDWKKDLKHLYLPKPGAFVLVDVPPMQFLMIDGHGDPNTSPAFQDRFTALYGVAYGIKFGVKPLGIEFSVGPAEGLWWSKGKPLDLTDKSGWDWTLMIMLPDEITAEQFQKARAEAVRKKGLPVIEQVRLERYHEGLSVQVMYHGPYSDEGPTILAMHQFIAEQGYVPNGKHHEIYIGDPRRSAPDKLQTVIRQPVRKA